MVSTLAGSTSSGYLDGPGTTARFKNPHGVSVDSSGNVWVSDYGNYMIRKVNTEGIYLT